MACPVSAMWTWRRPRLVIRVTFGGSPRNLIFVIGFHHLCGQCRSIVTRLLWELRSWFHLRSFMRLKTLVVAQNVALILLGLLPSRQWLHQYHRHQSPWIVVLTVMQQYVIRRSLCAVVWALAMSRQLTLLEHMQVRLCCVQPLPALSVVLSCLIRRLPPLWQQAVRCRHVFAPAPAALEFP